jgi:hypothetical protein
MDADRNIIVTDFIMAQRPPFDPLAVIAALAGHLLRWNISTVIGDAYAGGFIPSAFGRHRITYVPSKLSASELYLAAMTAFTSGTVALLDKADVIDQLVNLRRKIGQAGSESVQHMRGQHDDLANAVCGLIHLLTPHEQAAVDTSIYEHVGVISGPRMYGGTHTTIEDASHSYLTKGGYRSTSWP